MVVAVSCSAPLTPPLLLLPMTPPLGPPVFPLRKPHLPTSCVCVPLRGLISCLVFSFFPPPPSHGLSLSALSPSSPPSLSHACISPPSACPFSFCLSLSSFTLCKASTRVFLENFDFNWPVGRSRRSSQKRSMCFDMVPGVQLCVRAKCVCVFTRACETYRAEGEIGEKRGNDREEKSQKRRQDKRIRESKQSERARTRERVCARVCACECDCVAWIRNTHNIHTRISTKISLYAYIHEYNGICNARTLPVVPKQISCPSPCVLKK